MPAENRAAGELSAVGADRAARKLGVVEDGHAIGELGVSEVAAVEANAIKVEAQALPGHRKWTRTPTLCLQIRRRLD